MVNHTPGPWKTSVIHVNDPKICGELVPCVEIYSENNPHASWIAQVMERQCSDDKGAGVANAQLIATAPDLLESLQEFVDAISSFDSHSSASRKRMRLAVINANDVITKATSL